MLDWLTLTVDSSELSEMTLSTLQRRQSRLFLVDGEGAVQWEKPGRDTVRSDSHQLTVELGSTLRIYGSPARVGSDRLDNVFGSDDVRECANRMLAFVENAAGVELPDPERFDCTRMDVTENYHLGDLVTVKQALELLRHAEGGRFQVRTAAESVYWSPQSTYRSGKAYAKGPHMAYLRRKGTDFLTDDELSLCDGILRLELSLRRHYFSKICKKSWHQLTPRDLASEHQAYFGQLIGDVEISEVSDMRKRLIEAAKSLGMTEGMGRGAYAAWQWIRASGYADWRDGAARSTFYRHKRILRAAGLSYADFQARNVVPIRRRRIILDRPIKCWAELRKVA